MIVYLDMQLMQRIAEGLSETKIEVFFSFELRYQSIYKRMLNEDSDFSKGAILTVAVAETGKYLNMSPGH